MNRIGFWFTIFFMFLTLLIVMNLVSCNRPPPKLRRYQLENGRVVECAIHEADSCGYSFRQCTDGIVYRCQQNIWELPQ